MSNKISPPKAKKISYQYRIGNEIINDDYHWLRDYGWPEVKIAEIINYLNQENQYFDEITKEYTSLEDKLFAELKSRIKEDDESFPVKIDNYYYYSKTLKDKEYPIFCRKEDSLFNKEKIILDANKLATNHKAFSIGDSSVSPDHRLLAYSTDTDGGERYKIRVKDLEQDHNLTDEINDVHGSIVWHENNQGFYYTPVDENWRTNKVYFHKLGTKQSEDKLLYSETDFTFSVDIGKSASKNFIIINTESSSENELWLIDLQDENNNPFVFIKRRPKHLYYLDHRVGEFYVLTNDIGKNFRLICCSEDNFSEENWREVIAHSENIYLTNFLLFKSAIVIEQIEDGLTKVVVCNYEFTTKKVINVNQEETYDLDADFTEYNSPFLRLNYSSLTTPDSVLEYSFMEDKLYTRKIEEIPGDFMSSNYQAKRIYVPSYDNKKIPVSIVYRKNLKREDTPSPCLLYSYGAYGYAISPSFRSDIISLLDRGYIFAIAHIRGGDDLGYEWYESGKLLNKKNSFYDFISVSEYLVQSNYTTEELLAISGRSAGGMLVGVVANERPNLFKAIVCSVPFVDVLNTMLDENLPLTPGEFKEWGNPKNPEYFTYIKSYSPYDNVKRQPYPHIMVTAGLTDPRVTYWEPAKWVAKLREFKTNDSLILFKTQMNVGHRGETGRYNSLRETAQEYAFLLNVI